MLQDMALYVTCEETCSKMTADEWVEVVDLQSTQEEADTCLLLYALHATKTGSKAVIVTAEDTDVMLLCLAFHLSEVWKTEPHTNCLHHQTGLVIGRQRL